MSPDDERDRQSPEPGPGPADGASGSTGARRTGRVDARLPPEEVLHRWGYVYETPRGPKVVPVAPAAPDECLCGEPAEFVVEANWFSGRRSRDPVCGRHVDEVVHAIRTRQAQRNGG